MKRFLCLHTVPAGAFSVEQVKQIACEFQKDPNVRGYRSFLNLSEGKLACILEAENKDAIIAAFTKFGLPYDYIGEVELEADRGHVTELLVPEGAGVDEV